MTLAECLSNRAKNLAYYHIGISFEQLRKSLSEYVG